MSLGVCPRASPDNQRQNKHVESTFVSCLDPGSIPGSSTKMNFQFFVEIKIKTSASIPFLSFCLSVFQPVRLLACWPVSLFACSSVSLFAFQLFAFQPVRLFAFWLVRLSAVRLSACSPFSLLACSPFSLLAF